MSDTRYVVAGAPESFKGGIERNERHGRGLAGTCATSSAWLWSMPDGGPLHGHLAPPARGSHGGRP